MAPSAPSDQPPERPSLPRIALRSRVRALTGGRIDPADHDLDPAVPGLVADGRGFYQTDDLRGLGPALRWANAAGATGLTLISEAEVAGDLARRASHLAASAGPGGSAVDVEVWSATGAEVEPARPSPLRPPPALPETHRRFASMIAEAGARPVDDHGLLVAEVAGLEVARVVDDDPGGDNGAGPRLAVGVGQADRELQGFVNGHLDDDANLRRAIAAVARHRNPGSAAHPLSRLSRQRWLRSVLIDDPSLVGLDALEAVAPLRPPRTLLTREPVAAAGSNAVVVCSVGVDLDLLPEAADYRHRQQPEAELVVVVPERDRRLVTGALADLVPGLRLVSIDGPWEPPSTRRRARR